MGEMEDVLFQCMLGMTKDEFHRKAGLMRNPEGYSKQKYCPVCKKPIHANNRGDWFCEAYSGNYIKDGGCYWHRYRDGTNYWSTISEILDAGPGHIKREILGELSKDGL